MLRLRQTVASDIQKDESRSLSPRGGIGTARRHSSTRIVVYHRSDSEGRRLARGLTKVASRAYCSYSFRQAAMLVEEKEATILLYHSQMKGKPEFQALAEFHKYHPDVTIVVASRSPEDEKRAHAAGAQKFIHKPIETEDLHEAINQVKAL